MEDVCRCELCSRGNIDSVREALMTVLSDPTTRPSSQQRGDNFALILADGLLGRVHCKGCCVIQSENHIVDMPMIHSFLTEVLDVRAYSADSVFVSLEVRLCQRR